jgi:hypothetical protein
MRTEKKDQLHNATICRNVCAALRNVIHYEMFSRLSVSIG